MTDEFPDHIVERLNITALFPFNLKGPETDPLNAFRKIFNQEHIALPVGWEE